MSDPSGGPGVAARAAAAYRASAGPVGGSAPRPGPRRAHLTLSRVDPWSVMKTAAVFGVCLLVVGIVAVAALYAALASLGVFSSVQHTVVSAVNIHLPLSPGGIIGGAAVLGLINVVLLTALATIGAFIYNVTADLVGGLQVTLSERD